MNAIEAAIAAAPMTLVLGSGTGKSSAMEVLRDHLQTRGTTGHGKDVHFRKVDLSALSHSDMIAAPHELRASPEESAS